MIHLSGFAPLAHRYDGLILDLWGVIHDGVTAFPHAVDCLRRLSALGKTTILLSNAPRPNASVQSLMRGMGIPEDLYTLILTSGEAVRQALISPPDSWWAGLGRRVFLLGPERDLPIVSGLHLETVPRPEQATFVLNTGPDDHTNPTEISAFEAVLQRCRSTGLPMVCANPDLEVIRGGVRVLCAGALALRYEQLGGDVRYLGKPDPAIYQQALDQMDIDRRRVLVVGDSLRTDIAGAAGAQMDACWVLGGIQGSTLLTSEGDFSVMSAKHQALAAGLSPAATIPFFQW